MARRPRGGLDNGILETRATKFFVIGAFSPFCPELAVGCALKAQRWLHRGYLAPLVCWLSAE